ncbi:unnamed protein product [Symbiodinium natans]|uniref:Uncharacterized protein n=1 Tax=Symbiodinium natans TaxID=878477 RepID=A0A812KNA3_9DINO|nr:unnamed protein product [Symbiodinium natans]
MPLGPLKEDALKVSRIRAPQRDLPCTTWRKLGKRNCAPPAIEATLRRRQQQLQPSRSAPLLRARPRCADVDSPSSPSWSETDEGASTLVARSPSACSRPATGSRLFQDSPCYSNAEQPLPLQPRRKEAWFHMLAGEHSVEIPFDEIRESSHGEDYVWWFQDKRSRHRAIASSQAARRGAQARAISIWRAELSEISSVQQPTPGEKQLLFQKAALLRHLEMVAVPQGPKALAEAVAWCFGGAKRASDQLSSAFGDKVGLLQFSGLLALLDLDLNLLMGEQEAAALAQLFQEGSLSVVALLKGNCATHSIGESASLKAQAGCVSKGV